MLATRLHERLRRLDAGRKSARLAGRYLPGRARAAGRDERDRLVPAVRFRESEASLDVADDSPIRENISRRRLLANLPPDAASKLATTTRLRVQTRARPRSATRVGLSFERVGAEQLAILGQEVPDWLPKPKVDLPQIGLDVQRQIFNVGDDEDPRDAASNPAFFDVMFLDEELLVIKQGSPGGMFAAVAVDELAKGY